MEKEKKENLISQFKAKCRNNSLKVTPQRTIIYEELVGSREHPSVDILYRKVKDRLPDISFDTVYRTLTTFFDLGIASVVEGVCNSKRFEGNTENHYHFICTKCGKIIDIDEVVFDFDIPDTVEKKFRPRNVRVIFEGNCPSC